VTGSRGCPDEVLAVGSHSPERPYVDRTPANRNEGDARLGYDVEATRR
jgi:hypothetical protein